MPLAGTAVLAVGLWLHFDSQTKSVFELESDTKFYTGVYILIGAGALMMLVGFLGCCGASQESQCMLGLITDELKEFYMETYRKRTQPSAKDTLKAFQFTLNCCGVTGVLEQQFMDTCPAKTLSESFSTKSCPDAIDAVFKSKFNVIGAVGLGIAVMMIVGMIFSMVLCCAIRREREMEITPMPICPTLEGNGKCCQNMSGKVCSFCFPWVAKAGCHTGDVQALVARCSQAGLCLGAFLTSACLLPQLSPGRAHSLVIFSLAGLRLCFPKASEVQSQGLTTRVPNLRFPSGINYVLVGAAYGLTSRLMCCSVPGAHLLYNLIYVPESFWSLSSGKQRCSYVKTLKPAWNVRNHSRKKNGLSSFVSKEKQISSLHPVELGKSSVVQHVVILQQLWHMSTIIEYREKMNLTHGGCRDVFAEGEDVITCKMNLQAQASLAEAGLRTIVLGGRGRRKGGPKIPVINVSQMLFPCAVKFRLSPALFSCSHLQSYAGPASICRHPRLAVLCSCSAPAAAPLPFQHQQGRSCWLKGAGISSCCSVAGAVCEERAGWRRAGEAAPQDRFFSFGLAAPPAYTSITSACGESWGSPFQTHRLASTAGTALNILAVEMQGRASSQQGLLHGHISGDVPSSSSAQQRQRRGGASVQQVMIHGLGHLRSDLIVEKETKLKVKTFRVSCPSGAEKLSKQQTPLGRLFPSRTVNLTCQGPLHRAAVSTSLPRTESPLLPADGTSSLGPAGKAPISLPGKISINQCRFSFYKWFVLQSKSYLSSSSVWAKTFSAASLKACPQEEVPSPASLGRSPCVGRCFLEAYGQLQSCLEGGMWCRCSRGKFSQGHGSRKGILWSRFPLEPPVCPGNASPSPISPAEHPDSFSMCNQWSRPGFFSFFTKFTQVPCTPLLSALCGGTQTLLEGHHDQLQPGSTRPGTALSSQPADTYPEVPASQAHLETASAPGQHPVDLLVSFGFAHFSLCHPQAGRVWEHKIASEENIEDSPGRSLTSLYLPQFSQPLLAGRHLVPRHCPRPGCLILGHFGAKAIKEYGLWRSLLVSQVLSSPSQEVPYQEGLRGPSRSSIESFPQMSCAGTWSRMYWEEDNEIKDSNLLMVSLWQHNLTPQTSYFQLLKKRKAKKNQIKTQTKPPKKPETEVEHNCLPSRIFSILHATTSKKSPREFHACLCTSPDKSSFLCRVLQIQEVKQPILILSLNQDRMEGWSSTSLTKSFAHGRSPATSLEHAQAPEQTLLKTAFTKAKPAENAIAKSSKKIL
ncbi:hypothetical protein IHE44_0011979 [Lamprotornis superbus]|uniref:Tetraspanin n=1 Tax=Lamprotornis superbus TaxID=245042 RepID=A0A835NUY0_9PASS|nr:hypothetical protein IHE44_0011979 [Lamprotornis superbus]